MVTTRLVIDNAGMILKATKNTDEPKAALYKRVNYDVFRVLTKQRCVDHFLTIIVCTVLNQAVVFRGVSGTKHSLMP